MGIYLFRNCVEMFSLPVTVATVAALQPHRSSFLRLIYANRVVMIMHWQPRGLFLLHFFISINSRRPSINCLILIALGGIFSDGFLPSQSIRVCVAFMNYKQFQFARNRRPAANQPS